MLLLPTPPLPWRAQNPARCTFWAGATRPSSQNAGVTLAPPPAHFCPPPSAPSPSPRLGSTFGAAPTHFRLPSHSLIPELGWTLAPPFHVTRPSLPLPRAWLDFSSVPYALPARLAPTPPSSTLGRTSSLPQPSALPSLPALPPPRKDLVIRQPHPQPNLN